MFVFSIACAPTDMQQTNEAASTALSTIMTSMSATALSTCTQSVVLASHLCLSSPYGLLTMQNLYLELATILFIAPFWPIVRATINSFMLRRQRP